MKKRFFAMILVLVTVLGLGAGAMAEDAGTTVYVTIADSELKIAHESVNVTDTDGDGVLTINDALYLAHEAYYIGGAEKGYASFTGDYGLAISKLWGNESGTGFGYYVNDASAFSLADPVSNGDKVVAFVYTDTVAYSDTYCFFDKSALDADKGETVTLTLSAAGYDENWNPVTLPLAGAVITLDGEETEFVTDENGKVDVTFESKKDVTVSAVAQGKVLVPPVCKACVAGADADGPDWKMLVIVGAVVVLGGYLVIRTLVARKKK
ncbi:MAG: hypothetical protein E7460_10950 [Ruminococcaceae bacterium]|nr:hypothetical protein [Oscillospiraceae bacterium]